MTNHGKCYPLFRKNHEVQKSCPSLSEKTFFSLFFLVLFLVLFSIMVSFSVFEKEIYCYYNAVCFYIVPKKGP